MKASPMDSLFQLGVTRYAPPDSSSSSSSGGGVSNNSSGSNSNNSSNGCSPACGGGGSSGGGGKATTTLFNGNGSIVGLGEGLIKDGGNCADEEDAQATTNGAGGKKGNCDADGEDDDYHPTATPGGGVVYSEGTQKTDLLY
ncbi:loricrin-like [Drosophila madeirensis]